MIDDATLSKWELLAQMNPIMLSETVKILIAEIRRQQKETQAFADEKCRWFLERAKNAEADLAAHRAVVRELADTAQVWRDKIVRMGGARLAGPELFDLDAALAHPLVQ
mgnify:CR=1 FL=1